MEKQIMNKIEKFIISECKEAFGFCGVAESDNMVMINTGKEKDLIIKMELK